MTTETAERTDIRIPGERKSPPIRVRRLLARVTLALAALLVIIVVAVMLAPAGFWRWLIVHEVSRVTGRPVSISGNVAVHLFTFNPELSVEGLTIANPDWSAARNMVSIKKFDATLSPRSTWNGTHPDVRIGIPAQGNPR
jgi:uncharacterized protein involved in outer membrane biogenesis